MAALSSAFLAAAQVPTGGEFRDNATTADRQWDRDAAAAPNGDFVVTWTGRVGISRSSTRATVDRGISTTLAIAGPLMPPRRMSTSAVKVGPPRHPFRNGGTMPQSISPFLPRA